MYAAGTYLGATEAFGLDQELKLWLERLRDPKLLANLLRRYRWRNSSMEKVWSMFLGAPSAIQVGKQFANPGGKAVSLWDKGVKA